MSLFGFLFSRKSTALEFTETHVRIAGGEKSHAEVTLPGGLLEQGDVEGLQTPIQTILKSAGGGLGRDVTVLLPPSKVYTCLVQCAVQEMHKGRIRDELAKIIPDDLNALALQTKVLREENGMAYVGAAAVRRDILKTIQESVQKAKLRVGSITTLPCVLFSRMGKADTGEVIIVSASGSSTPIITLFYRGFPIDESVISAGGEKEVVGELRMLLEEYAGQQIFKEGRIVIYGSQALLKGCEDVIRMSVKEPAKKEEKASEVAKEKSKEKKKTDIEAKPAWSVESAFPNASASELPWVGIAAASARVGNVAVDFTGIAT